MILALRWRGWEVTTEMYGLDMGKMASQSLIPSLFSCKVTKIDLSGLPKILTWEVRIDLSGLPKILTCEVRIDLSGLKVDKNTAACVPHIHPLIP
jgi:hypothetical protein